MTGNPKRIQRKRTKGWKMPRNTVYVGRPTKYGNPFVVGKGWEWSYFTCRNSEEAVDMFASDIYCSSVGLTREAIAQLRGKNLACWCALDQPCHADVLLELANPSDKERP